MSDPQGDDCVIWWLDQAASELAVELGAPLPGWPVYLVEQFNSRFGRPGNARLWVDADLHFPDIDWPSLDRGAYAIESSSPGGIVIRRTDAHHVLSWPGFVTGRDLRPISCIALTHVDDGRTARGG